MHAAMDRGGRLVSEIASDPRRQWGLGRVHLGVLQPDPQLNGAAGSVPVLFHGELFNGAALARQLAEGGAPAMSASVPAIIRALYRATGPMFGRQLKGTFAAV